MERQRSSSDGSAIKVQREGKKFLPRGDELQHAASASVLPSEMMVSLPRRGRGVIQGNIISTVSAKRGESSNFLDLHEAQWHDTVVQLDQGHSNGGNIRFRWMYRSFDSNHKNDNNAGNNSSNDVSSNESDDQNKSECSSEDIPLRKSLQISVDSASDSPNRQSEIIERQRQQSKELLRDRFGFVELDQKVVLQEPYKRWLAGYADEQDCLRIREWENFLRGEHHHMAVGKRLVASLSKSRMSEGADRKGRLKALYRGGVPAVLRPQVWAAVVAEKMEKNKDVYRRLLVEYCARQVESEMAEQIEKDLTRTFPGHGIFTSADGVATLRRVLTLYSIYNPRVGYCQSMNFVCGILLLFLDEETAFWVLAHVVENLVPEYYVKHMIGLRSDQALFATILQHRNPKVASHLNKCEVRLQGGTLTDWFLPLFSNRLPTEPLLRFFDVFLHEGRRTIFRYTLAMIKLWESRVLSARDFEECYRVIRELPSSVGYTYGGQLCRLAVTRYGGKLISDLNGVRAKIYVEMEAKFAASTYSQLPSSNISVEELQELIVGYRKQAKTLTGDLSFEAFQRLTKRIWHALDLSLEQERVLFQSFDSNGDGSVDFAEFICGVSMVAAGSLNDKLRACFNVFDTDGDGQLNRNEIVRMIRTLETIVEQAPSTPRGGGPLSGSKPFRKKLSDRVTPKRLIRAADKNRNGQIDFDEFRSLIDSGSFTHISHAIQLFASRNAAERVLKSSSSAPAISSNSLRSALAASNSPSSSSDSPPVPASSN